MMRFRGNNAGPWGLVGLSILIVFFAIGSVGLVGVIENARVKEAAEGAIEFDAAVADVGDDMHVAVLNLRHYHRNIVFSGPSEPGITAFDAAYADLLTQIDLLEVIDVTTLDVPQPEQIRSLATAYHDAFRPSIVLFTSDPIAFNDASTTGLGQVDELEAYAVQIAETGEALTGSSLERVEEAAARERVILITLLVAAALVGVTLAILAGRILDSLRAANAHEQEARGRLAAALQTQSDFLADASHELRTPLTLIRGNAEIELAAESNSAARSQALDEILNEARRMSRLVDDLLFLARSDAGASLIEREYVPVRWLLARLPDAAEPMARHHGACLTTDLHGEGYVEVDPGRVQQAVLILVDNAARYTPAGECVDLRSRVDDGRLVISVIDRGPGIPADEQARIFERFYQVGPGRTRRRGSSGLGLSIARSIVEAHDGTIDVTSTVGQGTTMTIRIPLSREPVAPE